MPMINWAPLYMYGFTRNYSISSFFAVHSFPSSFNHPCQPSWIFLHPFFHPVSAGPRSSSSLCIMWWHLFTTQASGCLLLCSVIWLLPFPEWGHSLGQQSMDRTRQRSCRKARDTSVRFYLNTHRPNDWPCVFSLVSSFSSHVCVKNRHIMDLSLSTTTQSRYRNICSHRNKPPGNLPRELHSLGDIILVASEVT